MIKKLLLTLLYLYLTEACDEDCICYQDSDICEFCKDQNARLFYGQCYCEGQQMFKGKCYPLCSFTCACDPETSICFSCNYPFTELSEDKKSCKCPDGYFFSGSHCIEIPQCHYSCEQCEENSNVCLKCKDEFPLKLDNDIVACHCPDTNYIEVNQKCVFLSCLYFPWCGGCNYDNICEACKMYGAILSDDRLSCSCPPGQIERHDLNICALPCPEDCICGNNVFCIDCKDPNAEPQAPQYRSCACKEGYKEVNGVCQSLPRCHDSCFCDQIYSDICIECQSIVGIMSDDKKFCKCPPGYFYTDYGSCLEIPVCHSSCNCYSNSRICFSCKDDLAYKVDDFMSCNCLQGQMGIDGKCQINPVCSSSCNCQNGSDFCLSCKDPHAVISADNKQCECQQGYQSILTNPLKCEKSFNSLNSSCNSSCNCSGSSNVCLSCKDPHSQIDFQKRSCTCNQGFFVAQINPFRCDKSIKDISGDLNTPPIELTPCQIEIGLKTQYLKISTDCRIEVTENQNYISLKFRLDFSNSQVSEQCRDQYRTSIQFLDRNANNNFMNLQSKYITILPNGGISMKIPLIDVYDFYYNQNINDQQIIQTIKLRARIGEDRIYLRNHKWDVIVYTNRDQVEVFAIDVDKQETEGCQPGSECIVVADLDTISKICEDNSCSKIKSVPQYHVGDVFYAKIWFADATYKKKLNFQSLFFKTESNKIINFSAITTSSSQLDGLYISLPLVEPSQDAVIQVNMKIDPVNRLRVLEESNSVDSKKQFTIQINEAAQQQKNSSKNDSSYTIYIMFGLINIINLILIF